MPPKAKAAKASLHKLPEWNLGDLYANMDDAALAADIKQIEKSCLEFAKRYEGKVPAMDGAGLAKAISEYEAMQDTMGKVGSYAQLAFAKASNDPKIVQAYQTIQEKLTDYTSHILFFSLDLNKLDDAHMQRLLKDAKLARYSPWLRDMRAYRPYQLSDELEKLLLEKQVSGRGAWIRLFDESMTQLRFPMGNKKLTEAEVMSLMYSRDAATRKKAAECIGDVFKAKAPLFALVTNTLAKDKDIEDRWRKFPQPISSRNVSNYIEDEVVDALIETVKQNYKNTAHRYYNLKAKWLRKKSLEYWDRNAPLPFDMDRSYSWEEAKEIVLTSFKQFSPTIAEVGKEFFDKRWIDAPVHVGKTSGAFSHPVVPSAHPYILMNFQGRARDVMTLAHELGHGVHQVLSNRQGALMADTPLTLAETASVFGEQLTFQEMLKRETNPKFKKALIASKVEDMINTVVRQIAFCEFERQVHGARKQGELTAEQISEIWLKAQTESLGSGVRLHGNYRYFWTYIPHFIHTPFYVYAYAFGDCLVNALYATYEKEAKAGKAKEFEKKYIAMLEAGGTLRHKELLAPFGLDASKPDFWQRGLDVISHFIDQLE